MAPTETDNLLDDVRAAMSEVAGDPPAPDVDPPAPQEAPPPAETDQQKADRERDEKGRFAKAVDKPRETLTLKVSEDTSKTVKDPAVRAAEAAVAKPPEGERIAPPVEWKGAAKTRWERLPVDVQKELSTFSQQLAEERAQVAPFNDLLRVNSEWLINETGSVQEGLRTLMILGKMSVDNAPALIQHIARVKGIDLAALAGQPAGAQPNAGPQQAPDVNSIVERAVQQRFAQTENQQLQSAIDAFSADSRYPYFQDVRAEMSALLRGGLAKDLPDAYEKAVKLNPAIQSQLERARTEEAQKKRTEEAQRARNAANASLRGSPIPGATNGTGGSGSSVLDDVRAAAAELSGA